MELWAWTNKVPTLVWLSMSALCIAGGDFLSKSWANTPTLRGAFLTAFVYSMSSFFWLPALYWKNELALLGTLWGVVVSLLTVGIGVGIFHESLEARHWLGIALAIGASACLSN